MFQITTKQNRVTNLTFSAPLESFREHNYGAVDHESLARRWMKSGADVASVIVVTELLHESHWDDPVYVHKENILILSEVEREARRRITSRYYGERELAKIFKDRSYPTRQYNFKEDDEGASFKTRVEDALFRSQELALIPEVARDLLSECEFDESSGEGRHLRGNALRKAQEKRMEEIFLPQIHVEHSRVFSMPEPFLYWDERNAFQQWYFAIQSERICWAQGGSGGSGQREAHGRFAHACAFYEHLGQTVPTWIFKYDQHNRMVLVERMELFHAVGTDLTGNYPADWKKTQVLFKGRTLSLDYRTRKLSSEGSSSRKKRNRT